MSSSGGPARYYAAEGGRSNVHSRSPSPRPFGGDVDASWTGAGGGEGRQLERRPSPAPLEGGGRQLERRPSPGPPRVGKLERVVSAGGGDEQVRAQMCDDFQEVLRRVLAPATDQLESAARSLRRSQRQQQALLENTEAPQPWAETSQAPRQEWAGPHDRLRSDLRTDVRQVVACTLEAALSEQAERTKRQQLLLMQLMDQQLGMRKQLCVLLEGHTVQNNLLHRSQLRRDDYDTHLNGSQLNGAHLNGSQLNGAWDAAPEHAVRDGGAALPQRREVGEASQPPAFAPRESFPNVARTSDASAQTQADEELSVSQIGIENREPPAGARPRHLPKGTESQLAVAEEDVPDKILSAPSQKRKKKLSPLQALLASTQFSLICTFVIIANSVYMGIATHAEIRYALGHIGMESEPSGETAFYIEGSFLLFYVIELLLKIVGLQLLFFLGPDCAWNVFDLILIVSGILSLFNVSQGLTWMRVIRAIVRLVKTLRIFRVVRFFKDLRIIMLSIVSSIQTFFWGMVTIMLMIYMVAIVILQGVAEYVSSTPAARIDDSVLEVVRESWGSMGAAVMTQYMAITGGGPWGKAIEPLWFAGPLYYGIWLLYVAVMAMAILKLLTGIFVQNARAAAAQDHADTIQVNIKALFRDIDDDDSGYVSKEEFKSCVEHPSAKSFFDEMGISTTDAEKLFHLIDEGGDDQVDVDEFILGCQKFSGPSKNIDMVMTMAKVNETHADLEAFIVYVEDQFDRMSSRQGSSKMQRVKQVHEAVHADAL